LPIVFCALCGYMIYGSVAYKPYHSLAGVGITLVGLPLYFVQRWPAKSTRESTTECRVG
jgi:APA family basic amino acid/polyamine antiporter